jgi:hypothetical protein
MDRDEAAWRIRGDGAIEGPVRATFLVSGGPGDDDDEDETPIGDPDEDDWEGEDWDEDDDEPLQAAPRPPRGPGDVDEDELPVGDPPDDDPTDDPDDEDEGEGDDEPLHGRRAPRVPPSSAARSALADRRTPRVAGQVQPRSR